MPPPPTAMSAAHQCVCMYVSALKATDVLVAAVVTTTTTTTKRKGMKTVAVVALFVIFGFL